MTTSATTHHTHEPIKHGSGNIFADLGLPNPEEHLAKAALAVQIIEILRQRALTQTAAARILGIGQPKVSALMRGQLKNFSLERLCRFLNRLNSPLLCNYSDNEANSRRGEHSRGRVLFGTQADEPGASTH